MTNQTTSRGGALQAADEPYLLMLDVTPNPMWVHDERSLAFLGANEAALRLYGYSREEFLKMTLLDLVPAEDAKALLEAVGQQRELNAAPAGAWRHHRKDGSLIDVELTVSAGAFQQKPARLVLVHDITERKRAEEALKQQADLLDLTKDSILVRTMDDRISFWNRGAEELYGWRAAEAQGKVVHQLLRTQFPRAFEEIKAELHRRGWWDGELVQTTRMGRIVVVASRWALQLDAHGSPSAILEINTDISERKHAEEAVRQARDQLELRVQARTADLAAANEALVESQDRFQQMAENIREVFWLSNPSMTSISYVSPAYREISGRACDALYENPRTWFDAIHPEDRSRVRKTFQQPVPAQGYEQEYRVVRPNGAVRWVLERGFPVRDSSGKFYRLVGITRDITERKELEQEILAISEREQRRIGQDLHDDLCQQLVGIEFLSQALQQQLKRQPHVAQAAEIAQLIRAAIEHTRALARGLAPVKLEPEGLMEGLQALATRTGEVFRVRCDFECPEPVLIENTTAATHLYRIAQEAVSNALKHGRARKIHLRLTASSGSAVLTIEDEGTGFVDGFRNPRGMGLRIMQYRAEVVGGAWTIERGSAGGTRVTCKVPLASTGSSAIQP